MCNATYVHLPSPSLPAKGMEKCTCLTATTVENGTNLTRYFSDKPTKMLHKIKITHQQIFCNTVAIFEDWKFFLTRLFLQRCLSKRFIRSNCIYTQTRRAPIVEKDATVSSSKVRFSVIQYKNLLSIVKTYVVTWSSSKLNGDTFLLFSFFPRRRSSFSQQLHHP